MDYKWAQELGLIRKPAAFLSTICDERGEELLYAGMPISDVLRTTLVSVEFSVSFGSKEGICYIPVHVQCHMLCLG